MTTASGTAGRLDATAWTLLVLGLLSVGLGAFQAAVPPLLDRIAGALTTADDATRPMREALASGSGLSAILNIAFGAASIVAGVGVARRARFAYRTVTGLAWVSVAVLVVLAKPSLAPILVLAEGQPSSMRLVVGLASALVLAQVVVVVGFLRFWGRPEVRDAFR